MKVSGIRDLAFSEPKAFLAWSMHQSIPELESGFQLLLLVAFWINLHVTAVASMRRTEALASVKFYQILSIFIFFIRDRKSVV